ncbi:MAG TPA: amidophosphoribosyltransferase [Verrucomicrobiae bacterium]|nr:amidophosphoribosyltransferase [Verrucomicrobiae bacterium]
MSESLTPTQELDRPSEKCGIVAVYAFDQYMDVGEATYDLLLPLQRRGQDAAGILVTGEETVMRAHDGRIPDVFPDRATQLDRDAPNAHIALGHARYSTSGEGLMPYKGFAFNGNIANFKQVADRYGLPPEQQINDGHVVGELLNRLTLTHEDGLLGAIKELAPQLEGGFAIVATDGNQVIGVRDRHGLKPLTMGAFDDYPGGGFALVSEDVSLQKNGLTIVGDIEPGEIIIIDSQGLHKDRLEVEAERKLCMFEPVYYMNEDSNWEGRPVKNVRYELGRELAREHPVETDRADGAEVVVVGVPDSSLPAAEGFADELGVRCVQGLIKNPDYKKGRTFILPTQEERVQAVSEKFLIDKESVEGKVIVLEDDSIVRSTTVMKLSDMLFDAGALEVHIRINSPPIKWPCFYGINMGHDDDLIASDMLPREMAAVFGADSVAFQSEDRMAKALGVPLGNLCMGCILGKYPTPVPLSEARLNKQPALLNVIR